MFEKAGGPAGWMFYKLLSGRELHAEGGGLFQDVRASGWRLWHWGHRQDARATLRAGAKVRLGQGRDGLAAVA